MKKKTVILLLTLSVVLGGCGSTKETNADAPQTQKEQVQEQEQEVKQEEEQKEVNVENMDELKTISGKDYGSFILFDKSVDVENNAPNDELDVYEYDKKYTFDKDVKIYDYSGDIAGYVKAGETITTFMDKVDDVYVGFWFSTDREEFDIYYIKEEDISDYEEKAVKTGYSEKVSSLNTYEEIGGIKPNCDEDMERLQRFADDENYYTWEELWEKIDENIAEIGSSTPVQVDEKKEGFEMDGLFAPSFTRDSLNETAHDMAVNLMDFEEYYIEVTNVKDEYIEFEVWGK